MYLAVTIHKCLLKISSRSFPTSPIFPRMKYSFKDSMDHILMSTFLKSKQPTEAQREIYTTNRHIEKGDQRNRWTENFQRLLNKLALDNLPDIPTASKDFKPKTSTSEKETKNHQAPLK
ncbi:hypothetical protein PoB_004694500 [Plakobranchus ocellatus]|uniref:Uncharacterized protein n=1 Tax=Plakobranchus ocellatus TaxID=259542 RepID=A0AAV4BIV3_9GAST|nr:hypothetical protein PoB_004694500 [Plakobranchus ocellatus]